MSPQEHKREAERLMRGVEGQVEMVRRGLTTTFVDRPSTADLMLSIETIKMTVGMAKVHATLATMREI